MSFIILIITLSIFYIFNLYIVNYIYIYVCIDKYDALTNIYNFVSYDLYIVKP